MARKTLDAFAVIAIFIIILLVTSCDMLVPRTIKITNMSAGSVEISCDSFTDGTTCTIAPYSSVIKTVATGTTSIYVIEQGMYYQKGFEVIALNASGTVALKPDTSWVRFVNNSVYEISSATLVYDFTYGSDGKALASKTVPSGGEIWMMVKNPFTGKTLDFMIDGKRYNSIIAFDSPETGKMLTITLKNMTKIEKSYS